MLAGRDPAAHIALLLSAHAAWPAAPPLPRRSSAPLSPGRAPQVPRVLVRRHRPQPGRRRALEGRVARGAVQRGRQQAQVQHRGVHLLLVLARRLQHAVRRRRLRGVFQQHLPSPRGAQGAQVCIVSRLSRSRWHACQGASARDKPTGLRCLFWGHVSPVHVCVQGRQPDPEARRCGLSAHAPPRAGSRSPRCRSRSTTSGST